MSDWEECNHKWIDDYYGVRCTICNTFYPYGSEPWIVEDDLPEGEYMDTEYYYDEDTGDDTVSKDEETHSDDWGDTESEEEQGFDDDERD